MNKYDALILWFDQVGIDDVNLVGGKNASLGEMYRNLTQKGVKVPNGFAITAKAYYYFLDKAGIKDKINSLLESLNTKDIKQLQEVGSKIRYLIRNSPMPDDLANAIKEGYYNLGLQYSIEPDVAVRSSATAEDLPNASFAGQQETYLNVKGEKELLIYVKYCFASLFTNRAISYRADKGFDHFKIGLSVGVQKMVRSDKACSGVMFSIDTETGFKDVVLINASYGLGENIVQGAVNPDQYYVFKTTLKKGFRPVISKKIGNKDIKMIYAHDGNKTTKNVPVSINDKKRFALKDDEILKLAGWACTIEDYYSQKHNKYTPMDMEWAKDGVSNELFIVQARPETVMSQRNFNVIEKYVLDELPKEKKILVKGLSVGDKIGKGKVNIIKDVHHIREFKQGDVLVTEMTDPDWEPIMKIASAVVTNKGGRTCHAAIVSRELGVPCVVGTKNSTEILKQSSPVTVSCAEGETGKVYDGLLNYKVERINLDSIPETRTKIMMNVGNPEEAFKFSFIPNDGVGLAREEFIITSYINIHPNALIHFDELKDISVIKRINEITEGYSDKKQFFIDKLAEGIAILASAFYPKPVIVRFSDFKTNEYAGLLGGKLFEPKEGNPMLGWRGASRYYSQNYKDAFALECKAILKVRNEFGLTNVKTMIPFCRTVDEGKKVLAEMEKNGLKRGENGLSVYVMCEIPSNVILADEFSKIFDGFSIGSNDLTQLTLGLDRDSELVSSIYDERNEAVKRMISSVIKTAKNYKRKIGICGQAPSDFPDFAAFLVDQRIDSISLNPDTVIKTRLRISEEEKKLNLNNN